MNPGLVTKFFWVRIEMYCNPCLYTALNDFTGLEAIFFKHRTSRMPLFCRVAIDALIFSIPIALAQEPASAKLMIALWCSSMLIICRIFAIGLCQISGVGRP